MKIICCDRQGQSLLEIMIAVVVAALAILATVTILTLMLRISEEDTAWQTAAFLQKRLLDDVAATAERDWQQISGTFSNNRYQLATSTQEGVFEIKEGKSEMVVDGVVYSQFLLFQEVKRDAGGNIAASGILDPSTKRVEVVTSWPTKNGAATSTAVRYVTRVNNQVFVQTDWSGGATAPADPAIQITRKFLKASSTVDFSGEPGTIRIKP